MKILHITDMHFGPYQWSVDNKVLLERLNAFDADIVVNTGDMTTDSLEDEFQQAGDFLNKIQCKNIVSVMGNHDKFSKRSHQFFRKYIYDGPFIEPTDRTKIQKRDFYLNKAAVNLDHHLYDANFVRLFDINGEKIFFVALDTASMNTHYGFVEEEVLHALSAVITSTPHDRVFMCTHHSVLSADNEPLINSKRVTDFMLKHDIEVNFCGHTHEVDIVEVKDIILGKTYRQCMCSTLSGRMVRREKNMYCTYENFGAENEKITIVRMHLDGENLHFEETVL